MILPLLAAALCVIANGFFVAAEFGLVKVRATQLQARVDKGEQRAATALKIIHQLDAYLSATQLGITLASLALGWLGEPALAVVIGPLLHLMGVHSEALVHGISLSTAFAIITMLHIVVGELAPKSLAIQRTEAVALWVARPMHFFYVLTYPFLVVLSKASNLTIRFLFGINSPPHAEGALSAEEIRLVVAGGNLEPQKQELMARVMEGTDRPIRAVMVPRVDMVVLSLQDTPEQVMTLVHRDGYSRMPLIQGRDPDNIVGYIYIKDLLLGGGLPPGGLAALRRDVLFVPESRTVGNVLEDFKRTHIPIAIVVDEYGGTSGLVTMEDVLEEIVGELQDELDAESPKIVKREDGAFVVDGLVPISELAEYGIDIEPIEGHEILAGHIVSMLGRLARPGDTVQLGAFDATIEDVRARRVTRVRLSPRPMQPEERSPSARPPAMESTSERPTSMPPSRDTGHESKA